MAPATYALHLSFKTHPPYPYHTQLSDVGGVFPACRLRRRLEMGGCPPPCKFSSYLQAKTNKGLRLYSACSRLDAYQVVEASVPRHVKGISKTQAVYPLYRRGLRF